MKRLRASRGCASAILIISFALITTHANAWDLTTLNNWKTFKLIEQNDDISGFSDSGYGNTASRGTYDGLGANLSADGNTLHIQVNHETSDAAISRVDLNLANFQQAIASSIDNGGTPFPSSVITGMGYAYSSIYDSNYHAVTNSSPVASGTTGVGNYGNNNFDRFCSGTSYNPNSFGANRGFVDRIYMTGEETSGGKFYALDQATRQLWEVDDVGLGAWENAALVDTGNTTHVAVVLNSDVGSSPGDYIRMYVGQKNVDANGDGSIDFLERNGLRGGTVHYFDPDSGSTTDLPDGLVAGKWSTSTADALQETKLEDIHTNPLDGTELVFAAQNDGLYTMNLNMQFNGNNLDTVNSTVVINQIDDDDVGPIGAPDNVTWTVNGKLYVQEDGDGNDIFELDPDGTNILQIASASSEPSGIFDISELTGYEYGSVFLTSLQGNGSSGAQLAVLVSPNAAAAVPEPATAFTTAFATLVMGFFGWRRKRRGAARVVSG